MHVFRFLVTALLCAAAFQSLQSAPRPNIVFILCDDLGYGDIGVLYQNSRAPGLPKHLTPQLDSVAAEGMQLRNHYCAAPVCAPSRASLLLGVHQGHANVRDNQFDKELENNHTLASVLKRAGYATAAIGKWGLQGSGGTPALWPAYPTKRGFDYYFGYVRHSDGHEHYPKEGLYSGVKQVWENDSEISSNLDKCYTTDLFTARAKKWITDQRATNSALPFFLYLAYDTPHAVLELPTQAYPTGGGTNGGMQWLGTAGHMITTAIGTIDSWTHPDYANATYDDGTNPTASWPEIYKRYATSVRRIDDAVGDLKKLLQDLGIDNDTLLVFTSDNGPSIEDYLNLSPNYAANFFDNYGPFDGIKRDTWEGGIRMPTIARWPGHISGETTNTTPNAHYDWLPTFAELANLPPPARTDGVSLVPTLTGTGAQSPSTIYVEYYEGGNTPSYTEFEAAHRGRARNQMQAILLDGYKGIRYNIASHADDFEIYNLAVDPKEGTNLAATLGFATLQQQMKDRVLQLRRPNGSAARPYDNEFVPASPTVALTNGVLDYALFEGTWPYLPNFDALTSISTGRVAGLDLTVRPRDTNYGIAFSGYIEVPEDGAYTFYLISDAGALLRLHDATVIDDDFPHTGEEISAGIRLRAGRHPFRLFYKHGVGSSHLDLQYSGPNIVKQPVPLQFFFASGTGSSIPFAGNDRATTFRNVPITINVLANDSDDGLPASLSIVTVSLPASGTAVITNNQVRYTPATNFLGEDTFTYSVTDGASTNQARVIVSVVFTNGEYWFPFNQTSGLTTLDVGGSFEATLSAFNNDPDQWVTGRWNKALQFDGLANQVVMSGYKGILNANPRTVSAWIKTTTNTASQPIVSWGQNQNTKKWIFLMNPAGQIRVEVSGGAVVGTRALNDGQWHHVACTFTNDGTPNATDIKLYSDGQLEIISISTAQAIATSSAGDVQIGADMQNRFFKGVLDEVKIFPRALSAGEIVALANATNQSALAWHRRYFGDDSINWNADDDGDGLSRLAEYAWGTQPLIADARPPLLTAQISAQHLQLRFLRRITGTHELQYSLVASSDLINWNTLETTVDSVAPLNNSPEFEEVICSATTFINETNRLFVRQKISF